jgi:hypothetical protein
MVTPFSSAIWRKRSQMQLDGDGVRRPLPRMFASAARLNFKISELPQLRQCSRSAFPLCVIGQNSS